MTSINTQYLYMHRISLITLGLWPYHRTILVKLQSFLFSLLTISIIIFQLTTFLTTECTINFIIKVFSRTLFLLLCVIQYNSFWINTHIVKHLLENLQYVCSKLNDKNEIAIIKKCGQIAKYVAIGFILVAMGSVSISISALPLLRISFLTNKSKLHLKMLIMTEYFVDQEKYMYFILLHLYSAICIAVATLVGTAILMTGYFIHFCGLFDIASYRLKQAMRINSYEVTNRGNKNKIYKKISHAVDIHRTAIEFTEFFLYNFKIAFSFIMAIIVICLSLNLFQVSTVSMSCFTVMYSIQN
ncbi:hypothetical protein X777_10266 [Ooceraea biroi]|uniref:Odorant receptor n=1 Tax=Ooceraea biroi TaxID=2015173 RepID=A0A026W526_OOCBI|nr:hypothetical protein X777_10266 [Ooceraea biroi]